MAESDPEWSQLPRELLHFISQHLSDTDLLRFRSVCSTWRSAVSPPCPAANGRFPILPNEGISDTAWGFYLSKRTIYSLQSPSNETEIQSWIIKLERDNPTRMHLVHPLTRSVFKMVPDGFPKYFSFLNLRIKELGHEYTLQYINFSPLASSIGEAGNLYMEKVAVCMNFSGSEKDGFVLLTIHVSGKLVIYKSGDKKWTVINDLPSPYDDVIFREGRFYAVDTTGRAVVVNLDDGDSPNVSVIAHSVSGGDKKFLVDSFGDLLLVDKYLTVGPEDDLGYNEGFEFYEEFDCYMSERTVKFKVFRLDENAEKWVEVNNLGDRLLFLGDNCTFSASASEVFGHNECKGNCIFFTDQFFCGREDDWVWKSRGIGVFNLENGSIGPIDSYNGYSDKFWPPPAWVCSNVSVEGELDRLAV
ncbi:F-box protein SKIP23 [Abeliophyllum distichum]|uniref:F-box protein SKIP23 n=1 Tax=Abeliophyllum distichum TaxID=126358 RepID=A0ABD1TII2_9LAMI